MSASEAIVSARPLFRFGNQLSTCSGVVVFLGNLPTFDVAPGLCRVAIDKNEGDVSVRHSGTGEARLSSPHFSAQASKRFVTRISLSPVLP
jgi:hypothetical protein